MLRLKIFVKELLRRLGLNVSKLTPPELIGAFVKQCYPVNTNHELVRIGENCDGGYLVPNDLDGIEACFSPGVADTAGFELEMARRGIRSHLADYSVDAPPIRNELFHFEKRYLGKYENDIFMTVDNWVKRNTEDGERDLLLQMDIEGGEYEVLLDADPETLNRFRIMVIEFHGLISLTEPFGYKIIDATFKRLLKSHAVVHIHPNNGSRLFKIGGYTIPADMEFTFLRRDRIAYAEPATAFPRRLDRPCMLNKKELTLPECWYKDRSALRSPQQKFA